MSHDADQANEAVAAACRGTVEVATKAIDWFNHNADKIRQEKPALIREFRKFAQSARKLEAAAHRPMCAGVFGPSQAGKSYLISALARHGTAPLLAEFDGSPGGVDFVKDINPEGGQEATGLVTRFTLRRTPTPPGFPVALRLLSQTDIVKILGNTYLSDLDLSEEKEPGKEEIRALLDRLAAAAQSAPVDPLTEDDVYELQEYFEKHFKGEPIVKALSTGYWPAAAELAPRLPIAARAELFALLWGGIDRFTELFRTLYNALARLNFAADAFCPLGALVPRDDSIIDVRTLAGLGGTSGPASQLQVRAASGATVSLPRAAVAALIAELRIVIKDKPWDFFEHTDLLDFPGARSREHIPEVRAFLEQPNALQGLFLRGKVAYLFDRYCAEQELTSMLLCIGPSNQEVRTLPAMVKEWIDSTHGARPADRTRQETALFLILTKFDQEFEEKAGQAVDSKERWTTRLNASLLDFFGKAHDWPKEWTPGRPFDNILWLRNPNYKAKHILDYDETGTETGLRRGEEARIAGFRADYLANPKVQAHFKDPARAWDEAFRLNDGGISYLATSLAPVCNPDIKRRQIEARIAQQRAQMRDRLARYHVSGDLDAELKKRRAAAAMVVRQLAQCVQAQRFGQFLRTMQLGDAELADLYYEVETRPMRNGDDAGPARPPVAIGRPVLADDLLADVFGDDVPDLPADEPAAAPAQPPMDHAEHFAEAVVQHWMAEVRAMAETPRLCNYFRMAEPAMSALASELIGGARRLDLRAAIADRVRTITSFRQKLDQAMAKPALVAANIVNAYVNWLGFDRVPVEKRPTVGRGEQRRPVFAPRPPVKGGLALPPQPTPYDQMQYVDWMAAFLRLVEDNAASLGGQTIDVQQNARIGELVAALASARAAA